MQATSYNMYSVTNNALMAVARCPYTFTPTIKEYNPLAIKGAWHSMTWYDQEMLAEKTGKSLEFNAFDECYTMPDWFDLSMILAHGLFTHREMHAIEQDMIRYFGK